MTNQQEFEKAILNNDFLKVRMLIKNKNVNPTLNKNYALLISSQNGNNYIVELLLNDCRVNSTKTNNISLQLAAQNGHLNVIKLLLRDNIINPAKYENWAIFNAYKNKHFDVINYFLKDERVKSTLQKDNAEIYYNLITKIEVRQKIVFF